MRFVRGTVIATTTGQQDQKISREIALPNARVFLVRPGDLTTPVASALSDLSGRFIMKTDQMGDFRLCAEADGFARTCATKEFGLVEAAFSYGNLEVHVPASDNHVVAYGSVRLRDGSPARGFDPFLDVNSYPRIEMISAGGTYEGYVNNFGEYIVPQVPVLEHFELRVSIDGETLVQPIEGPIRLARGLNLPMDFVLPTSPPRLRLLSATSGGKPVQAAAPGATITLHAVAEDPDQDELEYRWAFSDGVAVSPTTGAEVQWKLPTQSGRFSASVMVSDGRGGYARDGIAVVASTAGARFSGTVVNQDGQPIGGALVQVNGRLINASSQGWFSFAVPVADRYVMTIRSLGIEAPGLTAYGTGSFVYKAPILGGRWVLRAAQVASVDPTQPFTLQHERKVTDCVGTGSSRIDWQPFLQPGLFQWQDGRGNTRALPDLGVSDPEAVQNVMRLLSRLNSALAAPFSEVTGVASQPVLDDILRCGPGIKVEIPANALEDSSKNPPAGNVQVALSSVSLAAPDQMPGDYSVLDAGGKIIAMESFGAGSVEIGAGSSRYNLKPGATATVTIPVDATQLVPGVKLQAEVPLLYYDEQQGYWRPEGTMRLTGSGASSAYEAEISHLSSLNADILKEDQSCVAVELDPAAGFQLPLSVEVVLQPSVVNPNVIQVRTLTVDSTKSNVIYNLPNNSDIVLTPIIPGTRPDGSTGNVPAGVFVVNTGGPQTSAVTPPPPNVDGTYYAESGGTPTGPCASRVTLTRLDSVRIAAQFEYLQGLYLQASNIDEFTAPISTEIDQGARDYYEQADPRDLRNSLALFKQKNRFGQPLDAAAGEVEFDAQYANSGDLGFGRDMHCRRNVASDGAFDYACYVTNYGQPPANNPDQQDANDTLDPLRTPDATVAMEFSRVENPPGDAVEFPDNNRAVKFFVYNTNDPAAAPLIKADLDGYGNRPVPQLCMVCHGGSSASLPADPSNPAGPKRGAFSSRTDIMSMGSNFLPFDLHLFNFPTSKSKSSQQLAFKNLNLEIVHGVAAATGTGAAIVELIDTSLYPGASTTQVEDRVIAGWDPANTSSNPHRFYRDVFARACRTCHTAGPFAAPRYDNLTDFQNDITDVQKRVCDQKVMPHAQRTNDIFWTSLDPNMAAFLELYGQTLSGWSPASASQCGQFYQAGGIAPSVFTSQIFPILSHNCSGTACHSFVGNAQFSVGSGVTTTYNSLLTAIANDGVSRYIVPSDPGTSLLYQRITTGGFGQRMPRFGADLTVTDTDIPTDGVDDAVEIQAWISAGAAGP
jgi:cytochrome c5